MVCLPLIPLQCTVGCLEGHKPIKYNYATTETSDIETRNEDGAVPIV